MIDRVVLDGAPDASRIAARLRALGHPAAIEQEGDGPDVLWVTASPVAARAAIVRGSRAWVVGNTGDLVRWEDLPLALALADCTLADVRRIVGAELRSKGLTLQSLSWTPDGAAVGRAEGDGGSVAVFVTSGPDGADPQIHVGDDAEAVARDREVFVKTLEANGEIATGTDPGSQKTHSLDAGESRRPRLERQRFSLSGGA